MSSYENYSQTARQYDATRIPVGVEIITGCLAQCGVPLATQRLLDAGCGTGNYAQAMLAQVGRISAVDLNAQMLARARDKLAREHRRGRIDFHLASIAELPFADAVFDGVMVNQVLHHLELGDDDRYPAHRRVLVEFARVLKPGGALIINTCSREQLRHGFWYYALIPAETARMCARHAPLDTLRQLMRDSGIPCQQCFVPTDALMQGEAYFNPRGPMSQSWRNGDSIWSTVSTQTLTQARARLTQLDTAGELQTYLQTHDRQRRHIGQLSFLYGRRAV